MFSTGHTANYKAHQNASCPTKDLSTASFRELWQLWCGCETLGLWHPSHKDLNWSIFDPRFYNKEVLSSQKWLQTRSLALLISSRIQPPQAFHPKRTNLETPFPNKLNTLIPLQALILQPPWHSQAISPKTQRPHTLLMLLEMPCPLFLSFPLNPLVPIWEPEVVAASELHRPTSIQSSCQRRTRTWLLEYPVHFWPLRTAFHRRLYNP